MDDQSALRDLLARADKVFALAGELGRVFRDEKLGDSVQFGGAGWEVHKPAFEQFCTTLLELRDAIKHPPNGFARVADQLRKCAEIASGIRNKVRTAAIDRYPTYTDFFPDFYSLAEDGRRVVNQATKAQRLDDPLAGLDDLAAGGQSGIDAAPMTPNAPAEASDAAAGSIPAEVAELQKKERERAKQEADAGKRTQRERENREHVELALENIYVPMPFAGEPIDYERWAVNILAFADVAKDAGAADFFLKANPERQDVREALSVIQAALAGGAEALAKRLDELHGAQDPRAWMRVFNDTGLFWMEVNPKRSTSAPEHQPADAVTTAPEPAGADSKPRPRKPKRSTERGEGREKLIAALTKHHQYADGGCLNLTPIGNNELARLAKVDQATASFFFKQQFGGHRNYKVACVDAAKLTAALKLLNGDFSPLHLFGRNPPGERGAGPS